jgi:hypothetical protein
MSLGTKGARAAFAAVGVLVAMAFGAVSASAETVSFTKAECTNWSVPSGVHQLTVSAVGATGQQASGIEPGEGGNGDEITATVEVTPKEQLDVCVGQGGGQGGEGIPGFAGGNGGGASGLGRGESFSAPMLIAGGGGGGGAEERGLASNQGGSGGDAGMPGGVPGEAGSAFNAAGPGRGGKGSHGVAEQFGDAGGGGGGGGGYVGGAGGSPSSGGAGGTDFCGGIGVTCGVTNAGAGTGTGSVTITYTAVPTSIQQCMKNGWKNYGTKFKNQGQCVKFVENTPS